MNFLCLPRNILNNVFDFLDGPSLSGIGEVSKASKEFVEDYSLNLESIVIESCDISTEELRLECDARDRTIWKICINAAIKSLAIEGILKAEFNECLRIKFRNTVRILGSSNMIRFLCPMKPRIRNSVWKFIDLQGVWQPEIINCVAEILDGKFISMIALDNMFNEQANFIHVFDLVEKITINQVTYNTNDFSKDTIDSLLRFADSVKGISLCIINLNKARPDIVSIVLEVLRRKCIYFYIFDESQESYPSSKDVERLLQEFHHMDKKLTFETYMNAMPMTRQVGEFTIKTEEIDFYQNSEVSITHVDYDEN